MERRNELILNYHSLKGMLTTFEWSTQNKEAAIRRIQQVQQEIERITVILGEEETQLRGL